MKIIDYTVSGGQIMELKVYSEDRSNWKLENVVQGLKDLRLMVLSIDPGITAENISFIQEETLIFNQSSSVSISVGSDEYNAQFKDVLYIPRNTAFSVTNNSLEPAKLYLYIAGAEEDYPVYFAKWAEVSKNTSRIRKLHKKNVYIMMDVEDKANKFIAGYTVYEPYTRAWPPHNHRDQEEIYSFIEGKGAMEVYLSEEEKTFVSSVQTGSHVPIPLLHYHPVFSHEIPLTFIWCISGERYWVGDKNDDFMKGKGTAITT
jgi:5-keto 4-deoxyuronate isomerase